MNRSTGVSWFFPEQSLTSCLTSECRGRRRKHDPDQTSCPSVDEVVDVIDIEDEDHGFTSFFVEMDSNIKRPMVTTCLFCSIHNCSSSCLYCTNTVCDMTVTNFLFS